MYYIQRSLSRKFNKKTNNEAATDVYLDMTRNGKCHPIHNHDESVIYDSVHPSSFICNKAAGNRESNPVGQTAVADNKIYDNLNDRSDGKKCCGAFPTKMVVLICILCIAICSISLQAAMFSTSQNSLVTKETHRRQLELYHKFVSLQAPDCAKLRELGWKHGEIYDVTIPGYGVTSLLCDMEDDNGGWTVIQRRQNGETSFNRTWLEYKHGFGDFRTEFWLGNEKLHHLTSSNHDLKICVWPDAGPQRCFVINYVTTESEESKYKLQINKASGWWYPSSTARTFSTHDNPSGHVCAAQTASGWWFPGGGDADCGDFNVNAVQLRQNKKETIDHLFNSSVTIRKTEMKIRKSSFYLSKVNYDADHQLQFT